MAEPAARLKTRDPSFDAAALERVVGALAARLDLPVDRLEEACLVAGSVAAGARRCAREDRLQSTLWDDRGQIELRIGPLTAGGAARVVADAGLAGIGNPIEVLSDGWAAEEADDGEYLRVMIGRPPA
jgi:hypothetical protein